MQKRKHQIKIDNVVHSNFQYLIQDFFGEGTNIEAVKSQIFGNLINDMSSTVALQAFKVDFEINSANEKFK